MPELIERVAALRERLALPPSGRKAPAEGIGLVPTMGALHEGHAELIRRGRAASGVLVVSVFVNPLQFNNPDDLARYPRTLDADLALCRDLGVDVVFAPPPDEVYPEPPACTVAIGHLADELCGRFRPGHFAGVATVVLKLFQMVQPRRAWFGEKDAQQLAIVRRMAADFNLPIEIVGVPTVREADGLAISSRNRLLSPDERRLAPCLYRALTVAKERVEGGERRASAVRDAAVREIPQAPGLRLEYLEVADPLDMSLVSAIAGPVRVAGALWVGHTRLIDNVLAAPAKSG